MRSSEVVIDYLLEDGSEFFTDLRLKLGREATLLVLSR